LQEKSAIRELMTEEHQMAQRELQYRLKLAEDELTERLHMVTSLFYLFFRRRLQQGRWNVSKSGDAARD